VCLKLNGTHQHFVYADDLNILGRRVYTIRRNRGDFIVASKEIVLDVNAEKSKYMIMSRDQNAEKISNIKTDIMSFEKLVQFKYVGTTVTNRNSIHEEIRSRLKSGSSCCLTVQKPLSSSLLSKDI